MNDELHHLLDGELPDEATVGLLRSLIDDEGKRSLFREQMKLQGALFRNENFDGMSSSEEAEMFDRLSSAIGVAERAPLVKRFGSAMLAGMLLIGAGLGFLTDRLITSGGNEPPPVVEQQSAIKQAVPPPAVPTPPPCNCDSVAAAVRDSVARAATTVSPASTRKAQVRTTKRRAVDNDPTGREAAKRLARKRTHSAQ